MYFNLSNSKVVYSKHNRKVNYKDDVTTLLLTPSAIEIPLKPAMRTSKLTTVIPTVIDIGFAVLEKVLGKWVQRYTGTYSAQDSFLEAGTRMVADLSFSRKIRMHDDLENAFSLTLKASKVKDVNAFYYYAESLNLDYAMAKTTSGGRIFDYTLEIIPVYLVNGSMMPQKATPIVIPMMEFGKQTFNDHTYRTSFIPLKEDAIYAGASIKIIESNPKKIHAEKILELFTTTSESIKTIVKEVIKVEEEG